MLETFSIPDIIIEQSQKVIGFMSSADLGNCKLMSFHIKSSFNFTEPSELIFSAKQKSGRVMKTRIQLTWRLQNRIWKIIKIILSYSLLTLTSAPKNKNNYFPAWFKGAELESKDKEKRQNDNDRFRLSIFYSWRFFLKLINLV